MTFETLGLSQPLLRAVRDEGYHTATPIQLRAIPEVLHGRDLLGCAQTGTGKTAAFALPTLHRLGQSRSEGTRSEGAGRAGHVDRLGGTQRGRSRVRGRWSRDGRRASVRPIRALILAPTRELAVQIGHSFQTYGQHTGLSQVVVYGGVSQNPQVRALQRGADTVIATPGRLLDLINQGHVDLSRVEMLILDEADQMLDMGFIHDLRRIVAQVPRERQTLMFSATMPDEIRDLATQWLRQPTYVEVAPVATPAQPIEQSVYFVEPSDKPQLLVHLLRHTANSRTLVFARTKHGADKLVKQLLKSGITAVAIHGNKSQNHRQRVLQQFKSLEPPVLVATDVAARGLDVDGISHVINYELPEIPEIYVHRIGRTGRAGARGVALSFCGRDERVRLRRIEKLTRRAIPGEMLPEDVVDRSGTNPEEAPSDRRRAHPAASKPHAARQTNRQVHGSAGRPNGSAHEPKKGKRSAGKRVVRSQAASGNQRTKSRRRRRSSGLKAASLS